MLANRTVYFFSLTAAISFYFASGVWFSWALVFVLLILPPVSFLCSLPQMLHLRLSLSAPETAEQNQLLLLRIHLQGSRLLPLPNMRMRLRICYQDEQELERMQLSQLSRQGGTVPLPTSLPGCVQTELFRVRVYDLLGLIWLPKKITQTTRSAVLPVPAAPKQLPDLSLFQAARLVPLPAGSFSELHDYRPYREGDNARSIHWKLSQKADQMIVREPVSPVRLRAAVAVTPPQTLQQLQDVLAQLRWVSERLIGQGIAHTVVWAGPDGTEAREVRDEQTGLDALAAACGMPVFREQVPTLHTQDCDWVYWVKAEEAGE